MLFDIDHISKSVVLEQNADIKYIAYLSNKAEILLNNKAYWHKITNGNPIVNIKKDMVIWLKNKIYRDSLVNTKHIP